jgi:spore cortex protein
LNKKVLYTLSTAFLLSGLTACNNNANEDAMGTNGTRQVGYYSDENNANGNAGGNAILPERDNDGPVTEMLDRAGDNNRGNNARGVNNNTRNNRAGDNDRAIINGGTINYRNAGDIGTRDNGFIDQQNDGGTNNNRGNNARGVNNNTRNNRAGDNDRALINGGTINYRNAGDIGTRDNGFIDQQNDGGTNNVRNEFNDNDNLTGIRYDHTLRGYGDNQGVNNRTRTNAANDARDNRFARTDYNYHGQMAGRDNNTRSSYNNNYNGRLAEDISNRVERVANVDDVRTIVNGDDVLVAIDTNDRNDATVKEEVRDAIRSVTAGKDVRVVTDESIFTRARNIDNNLRDGGPTGELDEDVRDMFQELGEEVDDAIRTPFRNTK